MAWSNGPLVVYHGTDHASAQSIRSSGIDPSRFRAKTDFGAGFYVTTTQHQAQQWANQRCRRMSSAQAEVLIYKVGRGTMETLRHLSFVIDDVSYYDFVAYCRSGATNHGPLPRRRPYQIIYGPVSLWPQKLVIQGCDQISFTDPRGATEFQSPWRSLIPKSGQRFF